MNNLFMTVLVPSLSLWVLIWLVSSFLYNLLLGG